MCAALVITPFVIALAININTVGRMRFPSAPSLKKYSLAVDNAGMSLATARRIRSPIALSSSSTILNGFTGLPSSYASSSLPSTPPAVAACALNDALWAPARGSSRVVSPSVPLGRSRRRSSVVSARRAAATIADARDGADDIGHSRAPASSAARRRRATPMSAREKNPIGARRRLARESRGETRARNATKATRETSVELSRACARDAAV